MMIVSIGQKWLNKKAYLSIYTPTLNKVVSQLQNKMATIV